MTDRHVLPPYSLRMPAELRDQLEEAAATNKRSLNAEIIARLEESFQPGTGSPTTVGEMIDLLAKMGEKSGRSVTITLGEPEKVDGDTLAPSEKRPLRKQTRPLGIDQAEWEARLMAEQATQQDSKNTSPAEPAKKPVRGVRR